MQAGTLLHELGHICNKDDQHRLLIKKYLTPLTTVVGILALGASQSDSHPLIHTGLCLSGLVATALTLPCLSPPSDKDGPDLATWLRAYSGEYMADSYALRHATMSQLIHHKEFLEKLPEYPQDWLDVHPAAHRRIKRIEKQIEMLEAQQ